LIFLTKPRNPNKKPGKPNNNPENPIKTFLFFFVWTSLQGFFFGLPGFFLGFPYF
jgi:hypothetical protein